MKDWLHFQNAFAKGASLTASSCQLVIFGFTCFALIASATSALADDGALAGGRHRLLVSTDLGGTDPDDVQSMAHLLVYVDSFDLEGLVSSPYGPGRKEHILKAIEAYERDLPNLRTYLEQNHPKLWIIEANATYRGWFVGGNQDGEWSKRDFVTKHIAGHGALGKHFADAKDTIKMGDTPSVARLLRGVSEDPSKPSWGGKYVRIWDGRKTVFDRSTTEKDVVEVFGVTEFVLPKPEGFTSKHSARMVFNKGKPASMGIDEGKMLRFRFSPRDAKGWSYVIESDFPGFDGESGKVTAKPPPLERTSRPSASHPNWWIDDPDPAAAEGIHPGARSVNQWRETFLRDFADRMDRCKAPAEKN